MRSIVEKKKSDRKSLAFSGGIKMNVSIIPFKMVESIKDEWKELSKNQTIFQSYEWNVNYLKIKGGGGEKLYSHC